MNTGTLYERAERGMRMINTKLYHLTDKENLKYIIDSKMLYTANSLKKKYSKKDVDYLCRFDGDVRLDDNVFLNKQIFIPKWGIKGSREEFYKSLDSFVFLWNDKKFKRNMKRSNEKYVCLEIDSANLIEKYSNYIYGCIYNSGSFFNVPEFCLRSKTEDQIKKEHKITYKKSKDMFVRYKEGQFVGDKGFEPSKSGKIKEVLFKCDISLEGVEYKIIEEDTF